jgi:hypothetical protein
MHYVEGDPEAYRTAVREVPEVEEWALTRDGADSTPTSSVTSRNRHGNCSAP